MKSGVTPNLACCEPICVAKAMLRTCASIGVSWLRTWASGCCSSRIAYRRLNPPTESLLTSNVDVLEEVSLQCGGTSAAMAVCRA